MISAKPESLPGTMADNTDLVSVVICFLNGEEFLSEAIASVYAQWYRAWELLLIDDGSTDKSSSIAQQHAVRDPQRVRYLEHVGHENRGTSASRNLGISQARGELVAFLDADDIWFPWRLERSVALLRENPTADMVYGESEYWYSWQGERRNFPDRVQRHGFRADTVVASPNLLVRYLDHSAALPCPSSLTLRREAARASGGFVESFRGMYEDQAFLARFCLHHDVFVAHECWDRYRQHQTGMCAEAELTGKVGEARRVYLAWLENYLLEEGVQGGRVWLALQYAKVVDRYQGPGWIDMVLRRCLRLLIRARLALRPEAQQERF